ncbi:MAG TPA: integrase arm-type DNA-binding domain-containing protein [Rhodanobacteraceae bacterium]|nr:integrase arm-type DNA-binding domain-containing protein [Rhodanobacteraceae bacterium]
MPPMLTDTAIRNAKPQPTPCRLADGGGLYLEVSPAGGKLWRWKYRIAGKEKRLSLGQYPATGLREARALRDDARRLLANGTDPGEVRRAQKAEQAKAAANTFGAVVAEWLAKQRPSMAPVTRAKAEWQVRLAQPLHARPLVEITAPEVLALLRKIEATGTNETAHRVKARIGQVFRYAIATGRAERDPTADLRGALAPVVSTPRAAVTDPAQVAGLLRALAGYVGQPTTAAALRLSPLLFARPGNLRAMEWTELDLVAGEWRIPAGKMKMREAHVVPLASQAVAILRKLQPLTGAGRYVFPGLRTPGRPMSENTVNAALRRLGFDKDTMTGHGFRALASTLLNEQGWAPDVIERQLAHAERNKVRAVYNRAQYLPERRKMMQAWADYLDALRKGADVVPIKRKA